MKRNKARLRKLLEQPRWKMVLFIFALNALLFWQTIVDYYFYLDFNFLFARREFFARSRRRFHWVGVQGVQPHRLAFIALTVILATGIIKAPDMQTMLYWSIGWGSVFSFFVIYRSIALFF